MVQGGVPAGDWLAETTGQVGLGGCDLRLWKAGDVRDGRGCAVVGGVESFSGKVSELTIFTFTPSSWATVLSTLRMRPSAPPAVAPDVTPLMTKRSSARWTALPPPVPHVERFA